MYISACKLAIKSLEIWLSGSRNEYKGSQPEPKRHPQKVQICHKAQAHSKPKSFIFLTISNVSVYYYLLYDFLSRLMLSAA